MELQKLQEVLFRQHVTRSGFQRLDDLAQDADMGEGLLAEHLLLFEHTRLGKALSSLGQYQVALLCIRQVKHIGRLQQWEQILEFQVEVSPKPAQVFASSPCLNQLDEP